VRKFRFLLSVVCFPYEKLKLFCSPAAVFFFDKSQKKTAAGRADGGFAPATPFVVRSAFGVWSVECGVRSECGVWSVENLCFFEF